MKPRFTKEDKKYIVTKPICVLSENKKNSKELNMILWNEKGPYYDIRKWENGLPKKGISLNRKEAIALYSALGEELMKITKKEF